MRLPEYDRLDALGLAELVARREVTALELLEAALERADRRNPPINAIVARYDDEARARARGPLPAGPLSGVPFLLKDLLAAWKGHPYTCSSRLLAGFVAPEDAETVRRFQAAGLVLFGQTNTPELGVMGVTEPALRGPTRNPWNPAFTSGGSSGGSAAAVAARIVPAAHGNDGGGSLRIPASVCGLFALKATRGRVTLAPAFGEALGGFAVEGVLTRSVRDSAALLDAIDGPAPGDPYAAPPKARPFLAEVGAPPGRLRIAFTREGLFARSTDPDCAAAVDAAARLLADLGHELVEARPEFPRDALARAYLVTLAAQTAADVELAARHVGRRPRGGDLEPETAALAAGGRALSAQDLVLARVELERASRGVAAFFEHHDALLTPTLARPPVRVGALAARSHERLALRFVARLGSRRLLERLFDELGSRSFDATGNTMLFNQTGQPAMSLPLHFSRDGLPIGVQVVGRFGDEAALFRLAAQVEDAAPWRDRAPSLP
ncbi:amidase [Anaeromyxobacter sp. PSR-1]|uniref:amidase n=1 Tax=Anaeromyxobacter sp. PSR-1 TaxID=1300915 RepID=UPI0005E3BFB2|nr:amidase [Anaeromyxobacter sp. PSR-1]GAO05363.1 6-aminohexanoate-cyclic-dimer hydrolase [Anaeromyxobacter sp. PSR-1]